MDDGFDVYHMDGVCHFNTTQGNSSSNYLMDVCSQGRDIFRPVEQMLYTPISTGSASLP